MSHALSETRVWVPDHRAGDREQCYLEWRPDARSPPAWWRAPGDRTYGRPTPESCRWVDSAAMTRRCCHPPETGLARRANDDTGRSPSARVRSDLRGTGRTRKGATLQWKWPQSSLRPDSSIIFQSEETTLYDLPAAVRTSWMGAQRRSCGWPRQTAAGPRTAWWTWARYET